MAEDGLEPEEGYFRPDFKEYAERELKWSRLHISGEPDDVYADECPFEGDDDLWEGIRWVFWSRQDDYPDRPLHHDYFSYISDACPSPEVRENIRLALHKMILDPCLNDTLVQFWAPTKTFEGRTLLTTQYQPFALGKTCDWDSDSRQRLCEYRMEMCRLYNNCFYADAESEEEQLGVPGRVFLHKFSESNSDVKYCSLKKYPQRNLALRCRIRGYWALPVFERSSQNCVGVLEISILYPSMAFYEYEKDFLRHLLDRFQEFGLQCFSRCEDREMRNGEVVMQLDSSDQSSMDPANNGQDVFTAKRNIREVTSSEESKRKTQKLEHSIIGVRIEVSLEDILKCSKMSRDAAARKLEVSISTLKRLCRDYGINRWPPRNMDLVHSSRPLPFENQEQAPRLSSDLPSNQVSAQEQTPRLSSDLPSNQVSASVVPIKSTCQDEDLVTIRAEFGDLMIKFRLSLLSTLVELHQEVAKRLNLEAGSYFVKYKDEDDMLILIACDDDLQDCARYFRSVAKTSIVIQLEPLIKKKKKKTT